MQREKVRIYALARELNIDSKELVDLCKQAGMDVKNQLSSLDPEQRDAVELLVRRGGAAVAVAPPPKAGPAIPTLLAPVPNLTSRPARREPEVVKAATAAPKPAAGAPPAEESAPPPVAARAPEAPGRSAEALPAQPEAPQARPPEPTGRPADLGSKAGAGTGKVPDLSQRPEGAPRPQRKREIRRPAIARIASPPPLKPRPATETKPQEQVQKPIARPPEVLRGGPVNLQNLRDKNAGAVEAPSAPDVDDEEGDHKGSKVRPTGVAGRDKRHQQRNERPATQGPGRGRASEQPDALAG